MSVKTENEFIERLSGAYRGNATTERLQDMKNWLLTLSLSESQLDDLYNFVTHQYEGQSFPALAKVIDIWEKNKPRSYMSKEYEAMADDLAFNRNVWRDKYDIDAKIKRCEEIRERQKSGARLDIYDIEFIHEWDDLRIEKCLGEEAGNSATMIKAHLEYVYGQLLKEARFNHITDKQPGYQDNTRRGLQHISQRV